MTAPVLAASGIGTRDILGLIAVGVVILVMWLLLKNLQRLVERGEGDD
jgi:hypothetical protein